MAALMFAGQPSGVFLLGVTIVLMSTVVCGLGGVLGSAFGQVILAPRSGLAPIYAAIVASIATVHAPSDAAFVPTLIATMTVATLTTGLFLWLLGQFHLGNLIRYIPYPVMAGFFAGIGLIFMLGGLTVASGESMSFANIRYYLSPVGLMLSLPAVLLGTLLYTVTLRVQHWSVFPLSLSAAALAFYAVLFVTGATTASAIASGWLPEASEVSFSFPLITISDLAIVDWPLVLGQAGAFATLALLATIILLVDTSGIEMIAELELDHDRELKVAGLTNIANGALGGYIGVQTAADTALVVKLGASSRVSGLTYVVLVALVLVLGTQIVSLIPSFVLGGLLFYLGLDFLITWAWSKRHDFPPKDFAVVLIILAAIALIGLLEGIAIGLIIAVILFVISYSRLSVIKSEHGGDTHDSIVVRHPEDQAFLKVASRGIWIMRLQGFLFFGTADGLFRLVKERVGRFQDPGLEYLVLDFSSVSEMDTSAVQALVKLRKYADREGIQVMLTGLGKRAEVRLAAAGFHADSPDEVTGKPFHPNLKEGVAWCEADLLTSLDRSTRGEMSDLEVILERLTGSKEAALSLVPFFKRQEVPVSSFLFREGDHGDSLFILVSGTTSVVLHAETESAHIIRVFEEGTILGEMALFTGEPRTAAVYADRDAVFYELTRSDFLNMQSSEPSAAGLFQSYIVRLLAERLERANREIESLR
jgi:SulP family sulfate permease